MSKALSFSALVRLSQPDNEEFPVTQEYFDKYQKSVRFLAQFKGVRENRKITISDMREVDTEGILPRWMSCIPKMHLNKDGSRKDSCINNEGTPEDTDELWCYFESFEGHTQDADVDHGYLGWLKAARVEIEGEKWTAAEIERMNAERIGVNVTTDDWKWEGWNVTLTDEEYEEYYILYQAYKLVWVIK